MMVKSTENVCYFKIFNIYVNKKYKKFQIFYMENSILKSYFACNKRI